MDLIAFEADRSGHVEYEMTDAAALETDDGPVDVPVFVECPARDSVNFSDLRNRPGSVSGRWSGWASRRGDCPGVHPASVRAYPAVSWSCGTSILPLPPSVASQESLAISGADPSHLAVLPSLAVHPRYDSLRRLASRSPQRRNFSSYPWDATLANCLLPRSR